MPPAPPGEQPVLGPLRPNRAARALRKQLAYGLGVTLLLQAGRFLTAVALGTAADLALGFFTTEAVTLLFTLLILWIVRRLDGVFENQDHYLLRLQAEEEKERG